MLIGNLVYMIEDPPLVSLFTHELILCYGLPRDKALFYNLQSSTEVEYRALACVTFEIVWLESFLGELHIPFPGPPLV